MKLHQTKSTILKKNMTHLFFFFSDSVFMPGGYSHSTVFLI